MLLCKIRPLASEFEGSPLEGDLRTSTLDHLTVGVDLVGEGWPVSGTYFNFSRGKKPFDVQFEIFAGSETGFNLKLGPSMIDHIAEVLGKIRS